MLLPATAEGGGCAVMVGAGVMVGVVTATMAEGEVEGAATRKKKERTRGACIYFWRYRGFDAGKKGMVQCFVKGYGLMLEIWVWFDVV